MCRCISQTRLSGLYFILSAVPLGTHSHQHICIYLFLAWRGQALTMGHHLLKSVVGPTQTFLIKTINNYRSPLSSMCSSRAQWPAVDRLLCMAAQCEAWSCYRRTNICARQDLSFFKKVRKTLAYKLTRLKTEQPLWDSSETSFLKCVFSKSAGQRSATCLLGAQWDTPLSRLIHLIDFLNQRLNGFTGQCCYISLKMN